MTNPFPGGVRPAALRLLALGVLFPLCPAALGQNLLQAFDGQWAFDLFGFAVDGAGDVDGDGFPDLIIGSPGSDPNGPASGAAWVRSGATGDLLYVFDGNATGDQHGWSVAGAGDVNDDGRADLIVGTPSSDGGGSAAGSATVYSGLDGSVLYLISGASAGDGAGTSVEGVGDVNDDGFDDFAVGSPGADVNGSGSGSVRIISGMNGSLLYTFHGGAAGDAFGAALAGAGDVNGDGFADIVVGAPGDDTGGVDAGSARVFSGVDGSILHDLLGGAAGDAFGSAVGGAGDVDGDTFDDVIVGAPRDGTGGVDAGSARVVSGAGGGTLLTLLGSAGDLLGGSVDGAGFVDGDTFPDLLVGASGADDNGIDSGRASVHSGADGSMLYSVSGDGANDRLGLAVAAAGDIDGDAFADQIFGAPFDDDAGSDAGRAFVYSGGYRLGTTYCAPSVPNSTGQSAEITATGSDVVARNDVTLRAARMTPNQFGYFLTSLTQGSVMNPGNSFGLLCLGGSIGRYNAQSQNSGPTGAFSLQIDLNSMPLNATSAQPGETWNFQAWFRDRGLFDTSAFTDAVSITFQ